MGTLCDLEAPIFFEGHQTRADEAERSIEPRAATDRCIVPSFWSPVLERYRLGFQAVGTIGLYENWVLPRLLNLAMRNRILDTYRRSAISSAGAQVLEIGVGSGLNLPLYGPPVRLVVGLDPSSKLLHLARMGSRKRLFRFRWSELRRRAFRSPMRPSMRS
jgi:hypothetical protein